MANKKVTAFGCVGLSIVASAMGCGSDDITPAEKIGVARQAFERDFGKWSALSLGPAEVIHASLLHNDKILVTSGSQFNCCLAWGLESDYLVDVAPNQSGTTWTALNTHPYPNHLEFPTLYDPFCAGHAHDANGGIVFAGGDNALFGCSTLNAGNRATSYFNPATGQWTQGSNMPQDRFYPTLATDTNATMWMFPGNWKDKRIYRYTGTAWVATNVMQAKDTYPRVHLFPDGDFFVSSPNDSFRNSVYRPSLNSWVAWGPDQVPGTVDGREDHDVYYGFRHSSVLLPLSPDVNHNYNLSARVLIVGGRKAWIKGVANQRWTETPARPPELKFTAPHPEAGTYPRRHHVNATLLPTGQVFVSGGGHEHTDDTAVKKPEIFGIDALGTVWDGWELEDTPATVARNYHSVTLLLRDGRVWNAGGNRNAQGTSCGGNNECTECGVATGEGTRQRIVEIFRPWYMERTDRPVISACPAMSGLGQTKTINLSSGDGMSIDRVSLMRAGSVTHGFDTDQRLIWLEVGQRTASTVQVKTPWNNSVAPPGKYMVFVLSNKLGTNEKRIPSIGCWTTRT